MNSTTDLQRPKTGNTLTSVNTQIRQIPLSYKVAFFLLIHIPLGLMMYRFSILATIHAWGTFIVGMLMIRRADSGRALALVGAYIAGSEILWRISGAGVFYEAGKYFIIALFGLTIFRHHRSWKLPLLPLVFMILLIPSIFSTAWFLPPELVRDALSFNLSGPLALTVSFIFFSNVRLSVADLRNIMFSLVGPLYGIAAVLVVTIASIQGEIYFSTSSNMATSAGFGPNQISALLGLGTVLAYLLALSNKSLLIRIVMFVTAIWFIVHTLLTFSRGGAYMALIATATASIYLIQVKQMRKIVVIALIIVALLGIFVVFPRLQEFTNGMLILRLEDTEASHRDTILVTDLQMWKENPIFGVGPGSSATYRGEILSVYGNKAHTEYTRLLAEHGLFGFIALVILFVTMWQSWRRPDTPLQRAFITTFLIWGALYMTINAMRTVSPAFLIGLGSVTLSSSNNANSEVGELTI